MSDVRQPLSAQPPRSARRPLRLWPGVGIVVVQWSVRYLVPRIASEWTAYAFLGAAAASLAFAVWWLGFSRLPAIEKWLGAALVIVALGATPLVLHPSIATGMMGMMFQISVLPFLCLALLIWAAVFGATAPVVRRATLALAIAVACSPWFFLRTDGLTGGAGSDLAWRWSTTAEERLLARESAAPATAGGAEFAGGSPDAAWPGFRGPRRDSVVEAPRLRTDWAATPPDELWRRPVGPGWSSFAVVGDVVLTQEQRGEEEVVAAYRLATGEPVWRHSTIARFWESNAGAGPRATPSVDADGRVFALGATGRLDALDLRDGSLVWSRDVAAGTGTETPMWAYSGSPLPIGDQVLVAVAGRLAAYDVADGAPRWMGPAAGDEVYTSPQRAVIDGVEQVLHLSDDGLAGFDLAGTELWTHAWSGTPIIQPARVGERGVLLAVDADSGLRRLEVAHRGGDWAVEERWTSRGLKPYFNDFVVHEGHAYGFDGGILSCIELESGARQWKGGRTGHGQLVLLPDQDLLVVVTERGEVMLVEAQPDGYSELGRFEALDGKTWNHPVVVGERLLVRNDREMAAFRLPI
ncbi:MAG: PQQ-binding-like beta-propeller repeat protein, partial [Acidobacteriota bacterium]